MRGLDKSSLARVLQTVAPGGKVLRVRPLHGGISSSVYLVHVQAEDGAREVVVVRRYGAYSQEHDPEACEREYRVLDVLYRRGLPVPRPFGVDRVGDPFLVMSRVAGRPELAPLDLSDYLRQMAQTLVQLHRVRLEALELLVDQRVYVERALRAELSPNADALQERVWAEAQRVWPAVRSSTRFALVHGDYWPGNILWNRSRLVGVIDWEQPRLGDPTKDVATCQGDLSILFGVSAAAQFLRCYVGAGGTVSDLRFWQLLVSTWAVREIAEWASVYPLLGRPELSVDVARQRIREFAQQALDGF
jgi:aminoglycoside phosphotransferase (APT) family kinase protein